VLANIIGMLNTIDLAQRPPDILFELNARFQFGCLAGSERRGWITNE